MLSYKGTAKVLHPWIIPTLKTPDRIFSLFSYQGSPDKGSPSLSSPSSGSPLHGPHANVDAISRMPDMSSVLQSIPGDVPSGVHIMPGQYPGIPYPVPDVTAVAHSSARYSFSPY